MFFQFEADFVESLRCIPMAVRFRLDLCGVKLKLHQWNALSQGDRQQLLDLPCTDAAQIQAYHDFLHHLIRDRTGETATDLPVDPHPAWDASQLPTAVVEKAAEQGVAVTLEQWRSLSPLQRFALVKLTRSSHENSNFGPALREFGLG